MEFDLREPSDSLFLFATIFNPFLQSSQKAEIMFYKKRLR